MEIRFVPSRDAHLDVDAELPAPVAQVFDFSGRVLRGRYRLRRRLGGGGMATVYEARDLTLGTSVAVKLIHTELSRDSDFRRRFLREARLGAELRHRHGVAVTDVGETEDGVLFLVMEHLEGQSLDFVLAARSGPLPWRRVCDLAGQLCEVLAEAHARGIVHRDIKPGNCFLVRTEDGRDFLKLLDLGLAKLVPAHRGLAGAAASRATGRLVGTPEYMSPEQALGLDQDHRVDIYALGVTMYRLLTGQLPFAGSPPVMLLRRHIDEVPRHLHELAPGVELPATLEAIVLRALAKNPDDRFQSAGEFARAIRAARELAEFDLAEIEAEDAYPDPVPPPPLRPLETPRAAAGLAAAGIALALVTVSLVVFTLSRSLREQPLVPGPQSPSASEAALLVPAPVMPVMERAAAPANAAPAASVARDDRPAVAEPGPAAPAEPPVARPPAPPRRRAEAPALLPVTGPLRPVPGALPQQTGARILATIAPGVARCARIVAPELARVELVVHLDGMRGTARALEFPAGAGDDLRRCVRQLAERLRFPVAEDTQLRHTYDLRPGARH